MTYDEKIAWAIEMAHKAHFKMYPGESPHASKADLICHALVYLDYHKEVGEKHFAHERKLAQELNRKKQQENE